MRVSHICRSAGKLTAAADRQSIAVGAQPLENIPVAEVAERACIYAVDLPSALVRSASAAPQAVSAFKNDVALRHLSAQLDRRLFCMLIYTAGDYDRTGSHRCDHGGVGQQAAAESVACRYAHSVSLRKRNAAADGDAYSRSLNLLPLTARAKSQYIRVAGGVEPVIAACFGRGRRNDYHGIRLAERAGTYCCGGACLFGINASVICHIGEIYVFSVGKDHGIAAHHYDAGVRRALQTEIDYTRMCLAAARICRIIVGYEAASVHIAQPLADRYRRDGIAVAERRVDLSAFAARGEGGVGR